MRKAVKLILVLAVVAALAASLLIRMFAATGSSQVANPSPAQAALNEARLVEEIRDYKSWTRVNPQPVNMDAAVAMLCAAPVGPKAASANPHFQKFITVYVNEKGRRALLEELNPSFPVGSVIVKEKLSTKDATEPELLTVMIKREKGFNPESGDWEYMVTNGTGTAVEVRGRLQSCQACHEMNKSTDYVNRNYLPKETRQALR